MKRRDAWKKGRRWMVRHWPTNVWLWDAWQYEAWTRAGNA